MHSEPFSFVPPLPFEGERIKVRGFESRHMQGIQRNPSPSPSPLRTARRPIRVRHSFIQSRRKRELRSVNSQARRPNFANPDLGGHCE
jgi:hypothetical protein